MGDDQAEGTRVGRLRHRRELIGGRRPPRLGLVLVGPIQVDADHEPVVQGRSIQGDPGGIGAPAEKLVAHVGHDLTDGPAGLRRL